MPYAFSVNSRSQASPGTVYALLIQPGTWPSWSRLDAAEVEGGGDPASPQQVGDIRIFHLGRSVYRERITGLVPGQRFIYETASGPFRSYRSIVELTEAPQGGTDITWSATFEPKLSLSGPFLRWYLTRYMRRMADGLARYATRHTATGAAESHA